MGVINCPNCGIEQDDSKNFCGICGFPLIENNDKQNIQTESAQTANQHVQTDRNQTPYQNSNYNTQNNQNKKGNGKLIAIIAIIVVAVLAIIIIGVLIIYNTLFKEINTNTNINSNTKTNTVIGSQDDLDYIDESEIPYVFSETEDYIGKGVVLTGQVTYIESQTKDGIYLEVYQDPENYNNDMLVYCSDKSINLQEGDYIEINGYISDDSKFEDYYYYGIPMIEALSIKKSNYIDTISPTLKELTLNQTLEQYGYVVTIEKIQFAESETRIYVSVTNNGSSNFMLDSYGTIVQNGYQLNATYNYEANYAELPDEILPGATANGIIVFDHLDSELPFTLQIGGYSENWDEDIQDYLYSINQ